MRRHRAEGEAGFTVLELLVSLALMALLLSAMPFTFQMGRRAWETASTLDRTAAADVVARYLRERISQAMALRERPRGRTAGVAFDGRETSMVFVAPALDGPAGPGLFRYEVAASDRRLVMRWWPYTPQVAAIADAPAGERELRADLQSLAIRYFGRTADGDGSGWTTSWTERTELPELVELHVVSSASRDSRPMLIDLASRRGATAR